MTSLRSLRSFLASVAQDAISRIRAWPRAKQLAVALAVTLAVLVVITFDVPPLSTLRDWAGTAGPWFPVAFWAAYVVITQLPVPRTILTLSAGVLFGPWTGIALALSATAASAALSLTVVRFFVGDWIRPYLTHPAVAGVNEHLERRGWVAVLSLRMIAGVPFSIMNYTAALTSIRLLPFTVATFFGSAPGTIAVVLFGDTLTGEADPVIIVITVALALLGVTGLILDAATPVKSKR
ncbi:TVP38/TMEM64 family protein [Corynebacterium guangdongense]|uniref:TVP38/TMEM64 family membrane protein n=1 Tax=Corynebacterium guangdongense TaxID=1783348 RepID=A0ABU1ZZN5_9CORY|nr:TVP38/TMEM64 family protein [Corynebacterium guangdongense]MDR7329358.1 putative membrane protein YdjX (TVP38/TMEM64 family) [Corynebacterium guangdongense]WJZ17923.1 TVP38/TMEM64 family inner membrane protein YdjZ [Corynebacterium guangdongense]